MVLLGIVPVLMHTPPTAACFSTIATRFPAFAPWMAARWPPGPDPTTIRSYGCIRRVQRAFLFGGTYRRGHHRVGSINDTLVSECGNVLGIGIAAGQGDKMFLCGESAAVRHRARPRIRAMRSKNARLACVRQIRGKNLVADALAMLRVFQRKQHFHAFVKVSRHPVRASQVDIRLSSVFEIENSAVLEKPPDDTSHVNPAADTAEFRHQGALAAHDEINLHARARSTV